MTLGIIGTAGRGTDGVAFKTTPRLWRAMVAVTQVTLTILKPDRLVSGGAARADHLAVLAYLDGLVPNLTLHLPAEWAGHGFKETSSRFDTGRTSNWYHSLWSEERGMSSLDEIQRAIEKGAKVCTGAGGFKERNTDIAREADAMLAFTFGAGAQLKDGGTADTWGKFLAKRDAKAHEMAMNGAPWPSSAYPAYHYCLNQHLLYAL